MKKTAVIAVVLVLYSFQVEARSKGAPASACATLIPRHRKNQAINESFPYEVDLSALASGYEAGKSYKIQLRGTSRDSNFKGFLIQARTVVDGSAVGSFDSGTLHQQACSNETAATHVNNQQKTTVNLQWTAPPADTGPINFWYSFVDVHRRSQSRFWAREKSAVVNEACPINGQVRKECASDSDCHQICGDTEPKICPAVCVVNGCECPNGTVIDEDKNKCVAPSECTGTCPVKGQVLKNCTSCATTCTSRFHFTVCPINCTHDESRCECPDGTVIDEDRNECVSPDKCPEISCPAEGQSYSSDCHPLNATCSNPSPPVICDFPMCSCPIEQVLNEELTKCINVSECSCPIKGQVRRGCASDPSCHQTCNNNEPIICPAVCIFNGCECPNGTVIDENKNECVAPSECTATCPVKGQILKNCTSCATTCISRFYFGYCPINCTHDEFRCECPDGTVIDEDRNECVPPDMCPEIPCPAEGQSFSSNCRPLNATCSNPSPPSICDLAMCSCPTGQVLDEELNKCVNVSECTCPIKGQVRKECAAHPSCHQTCNNNETAICPAVCVVNGCECPNGTVIDEDKNECVAPNECSTACPIKGQVRKECASHPSCHQTCNNNETAICPAVCIVNGCECPNGTVIDEDKNECVAPNECSTACPIKGQVRKECASHPSCHQTCNNNETVLCPEICIINGCECPDGTVIDEDKNECVAPSECIACPVQGQVRKTCAAHPSCTTTCSNRFAQILCIQVCVINGCECPTGTVVDEDLNRCVLPSECPEISCPIEGQFYTADCFGENATCSNPNPPALCDYPQCVCPQGQVIDTNAKVCINGTDCSNACKISKISGNAKYKKGKKRLILNFSSNRRGENALFQCQIDNERFSHCTSPMKWKNLNLSQGKHFVRVQGSCMYNGVVTSSAISKKLSFKVKN